LVTITGSDCKSLQAGSIPAVASTRLRLRASAGKTFAWRVSAEALAKADNLRRGRHFFEPVHALQSVLALL